MGRLARHGPYDACMMRFGKNVHAKSPSGQKMPVLYEKKRNGGGEGIRTPERNFFL